MKIEEIFEYMDPILPVDFFSYRLSIPRLSDASLPLPKTVPALPDTTSLTGDERFATLYLGWHEEGILGKVVVESPVEKCCFPEYAKGDSFELFLDTRDHKKSGFATRFCHHFVFLPESVQGVQAEEVTRFRTEDSHPLSPSSEIIVSCKVEKKSYELSFYIKDTALYGYAPAEFPKIGCAYKVNRYKNTPQHFSVSSTYFDVLDHPSLWASLALSSSSREF